jgi:uncharacterized protein YebE (UPF0316 family)
MNILIYIIIFLSKVLENALATLRLIVVSNGKKMTGAALQFIISLVWVVVTGSVLVDITKDPLKVVFFALGSMIGSYLGSYFEEKMAMGSNALTVIVDSENSKLVTDKVREMGYAVTLTKGEGKDKTRNILYIVVSRKRQKKIISMISEIDDTAMIITSHTSSIQGGFVH